MKTIGIKLADGSFFPVLEEDTPAEKVFELTTAHNNQTKIMVDLYRSKNCTMEDAEYVDSLQIESLNAHPNGEPTISFCVSIDENNKLSARIKDQETGKESDTTITLVSRTVEERLVTDEYNIEDTTGEFPIEENNDAEEKSESIIPKVAAVAAGVGLLSAADKLLNKEEADAEEKKEEEPAIEEEIPAEEPVSVIDEPLEDIPTEPISSEEIEDELSDLNTEDSNIVDNEMLNAADTIDFGDDSLEFNPVEEIDLEDKAPEEEIAEDTSFIEENNDLDQVNSFETEEPFESEAAFDEPLESEEPVEMAEDTTALDEFDLDLPDFDAPVEETESPVKETPLEETTTEDTVSEDNFSLDDLNFDEPASESPVEETTEDTTVAFDTTPADDATVAFDTEETEDFSEDSIPEEAEEPVTPDFSLDIPDDFDDNTSADDLTSDDKFFSNNTDSFGEPVENDLSLPDFDDIDDIKEEESPEMPDDFFNDTSLDNFDIPEETEPSSASASAGGLSFTGLYDKETEMGVPGSQDDDIKKKTKTPVIICVVCAIICIIATLLILFVIPSKYNLINKAEKETVVEKPVEKQDEIIELTPEPEPVPEAKEDEVVVIEKAEEVVPEQPEVIEEKIENITYKITWGDTLWDIADTYYKNPWRYKYIARYNGIKNPDHIISGTFITIPAE